MKLFKLIHFSILVSLVGSSHYTIAEESSADDLQTKPNIVVFVADDMGWGDSATYGKRADPNAKHGQAGSGGCEVYSVLCGVWSMFTVAFGDSYRADAISKWRLAALVG